uniref:Putative Flavonol synthase/flavanone 3-hydroxylase n=1 Tax=Aegilops tauschii TaxID=37682 RepID=M8CQV1_AEGTA
MPTPSHRHCPNHPKGGHGDCAGACGGDGIPVIDLGVLLNGNAEQRSQATRELGQACEDWGFFMVINHGVPEALQEEVMEACKELYSLPRDEKADYIAAGPKDPIRIGTGLFYSDVDDAICRRDYMKMIAHPEFHCPAKPAKLSYIDYTVIVRDIAVEYSARTRQLLLELAKAISESLGLDRGRISEVLNLESCFQILVGNNYPPYAGSDGVMGISAHSDHGLLTLLFQNGVDGLQVMHNGQWVTAKPLPGSLFILTGDQLEIVSNGRYKAVLHRALVHGGQTRMSFVSLVGPCLDAVVEPVLELAQNDPQGMKFRGIRYRDYMEHQQSSKMNTKAALDIVRVQGDILTCESTPNSSTEADSSGYSPTS